MHWQAQGNRCVAARVEHAQPACHASCQPTPLTERSPTPQAHQCPAAASQCWRLPHPPQSAAPPHPATTGLEVGAGERTSCETRVAAAARCAAAPSLPRPSASPLEAQTAAPRGRPRRKTQSLGPAASSLHREGRYRGADGVRSRRAGRTRRRRLRRHSCRPGCSGQCDEPGRLARLETSHPCFADHAGQPQARQKAHPTKGTHWAQPLAIHDRCCSSHANGGLLMEAMIGMQGRSVLGSSRRKPAPPPAGPCI